MTPDPFDLERFVTAQDPVIARVLDELAAGRKQSHWMWFVFPQLRGLGHSPAAQFYGIGSLQEARAYLRHPALGPRLDQCVRTTMTIRGRSLHDIFGSPDDLKFRSSMTLFALTRPEADNLFRAALEQCCGGEIDQATVSLLDGTPSS